MISIAVIGWQVFIFITIVISGRAASVTSAIWVIWTIVQVFTFALSVLQFGTIFVAYMVTKSVNENEGGGGFIDSFIDNFRKEESEPEKESYLGYYLTAAIACILGLHMYFNEPAPVLSKNNVIHQTSATTLPVTPDSKKPSNILPSKPPFTIEVDPSHARVRIMNIKPKYQDGIELLPGSYDVFVDAKGYHSWRNTINHRGISTIQRVVLTKKNIPSNTRQPAVTSKLIDGRYRDNRDGTVTDVKSNLRWMRCSVGQSWDGSTCIGRARVAWPDLKEKKFKITRSDFDIPFDGYDGWRVPTITELNSLILCKSSTHHKYPYKGQIKLDRCDKDLDTRFQSPTINLQAFPNTPSELYISSTTVTSTNGPYAQWWYVGFNSGFSNSRSVTWKKHHYLRLVR